MIEYYMCDDGDYVLQVEWTPDDFLIHQAWLVPGTELEDWSERPPRNSNDTAS